MSIDEHIIHEFASNYILVMGHCIKTRVFIDLICSNYSITIELNLNYSIKIKLYFI